MEPNYEILIRIIIIIISQTFGFIYIKKKFD